MNGVFFDMSHTNFKSNYAQKQIQLVFYQKEDCRGENCYMTLHANCCFSCQGVLDINSFIILFRLYICSV